MFYQCKMSVRNSFLLSPKPGGRHSQEEFFRKASLLADDKEFTIFPFIRVKKEFNWSVVFPCYETTGYEIDSNILVQVFTRKHGQGLNCSMGNWNNAISFCKVRAVRISELLPYRLARSDNLAHKGVNKYICKAIPILNDLNK